MSDRGVQEYEPDCAIKKVLGTGFSFEGHLSDDHCFQCQQLLDESVRLFFEQGLEEVVGLERLLMQTPFDAAGDAFFMQAHGYAYGLRGQAQLLGFTLITQISGHMIESIGHMGLGNAQKYQLVRRIAEVLRLAFNERIQDAGGAKGIELLAILEGYLDA